MSKPGASQLPDFLGRISAHRDRERQNVKGRQSSQPERLNVRTKRSISTVKAAPGCTVCSSSSPAWITSPFLRPRRANSESGATAKTLKPFSAGTTRICVISCGSDLLDVDVRDVNALRGWMRAGARRLRAGAELFAPASAVDDQPVAVDLHDARAENLVAQAWPHRAAALAVEHQGRRPPPPTIDQRAQQGDGQDREPHAEVAGRFPGDARGRSRPRDGIAVEGSRRGAQQNPESQDFHGSARACKMRSRGVERRWARAAQVRAHRSEPRVLARHGVTDAFEAAVVQSVEERRGDSRAPTEPHRSESR